MSRPERPEIAFFDSNASLGRSNFRTPDSPYDKAGLLAEMDHCRLSRSLVFHAAARDQDARQANEALIALCRGESRLAPAAVLGSTPCVAGRNLIAELKSYLERGVRAFRMFPNYHGLDFSDPALKELLGALQQKNLPLWLDFDTPWYNFAQIGQHEHRSPTFPVVESLAREYPGLTLIVCAANYNHGGRILAGLGRFPNIRLETSHFQGLEMVRRVCETHGPHRLLFGSGLPLVSAGPARAMLMYSEISDDDKRRIAAGNLEELLGENPTTSLPEDSRRSPIMLQADRGEPITTAEVHDSHGHIAPEGCEGLVGLTLGPQDAPSIIRALDRTGTRSLVVSSWQIYGGDAPAGNALAAEAAEHYPGRILPYMVVNPNYPEDWESQVRACFTERRFFGLKPYPFPQHSSITGPGYRPMLELAQRLKLPILCHLGLEPMAGVTPSQVEELAPRYHEARFMIAHSGASYKVAEQLVVLARKFSNVFLEINYTSVPYRMISYLAANAGAEKVLYGSDTPMRDPAPIMGWVVYDHLTDTERRQILGGNLLALARAAGYAGRMG